MARILVADDSPLVRRMFERLLGDAGHEVVTVVDGLEAVERALEGDLSLVVLDVMMPRMNGYVACRLLKSQATTRAMPVIILSGRTDAGDRYWGLETGADHYVTKDSPPEDVLDLIEELLSKTPVAPKASAQPAARADVLGHVSELLDRKLFEATILSELGHVAGSLERADKAFTSVMGVVAKAVGFSAGALAFAEPGQLEILVMINRSLPPAALDDFERRIGASLTGGKGPDPSMRVSTRRFAEPAGRESSRPAERSIVDFETLSVGLASGSTGLLALAGESVSQVVEEHRPFLARVAGQALMVTQNARLFERVSELSMRDGLTGVYNHRHAMDLIRAELDRSQRYGSPLSLLLIDIDYFKTVNDSHGHLAGDGVLHKVARLISEALRAVDHVGRYGGDEFVAILPHTDREAARSTAERLREMIATHELGSAPAGFRVTVSIGVATNTATDGRSPSDLLGEADAALYRAKEAGRDRVV